jgi:hypothetical protein
VRSYGARIEITFGHGDGEVACTLGAAAATQRRAAWRRLTIRSRVETLPRGGRLWLRREDAASARALAEQEAACCGFLEIRLLDDEDGLRLDMTSSAAEAAPVIAALIGPDSA